MGKRQIDAMQTRLKVIVAAKRLIEKNGFKKCLEIEGGK